MPDIVALPNNKIPDILKLESKEKFRRRLLIGSRLLAFVLILAIVFFGYVNYQFGDLVSKSPCYACGLYEGKKCDYMYFTEYENATKEDFLMNLAIYNNNKSGQFKILSNPPLDINITQFKEAINNSQRENK